MPTPKLLLWMKSYQERETRTYKNDNGGQEYQFDRVAGLIIQWFNKTLKWDPAALRTVSG